LKEIGVFYPTISPKNFYSSALKVVQKKGPYFVSREALHQLASGIVSLASLERHTGNHENAGDTT